MKNSDISKFIGKSRQMLEAAVSGKRNFSYQTAKRASAIFGGTVEVWLDNDPVYVAMRQQLFGKFKRQQVKR